MHAGGFWQDEQGMNMLDTGAHFYEVYETKDGKYVSIGSIEPQFYALLLQKLGLDGADLPAQMDRTAWPAMSKRFATIFKGKTRDEWCAIMEGSDVCFAPVLSIAEAPKHHHAAARGAYVDVGGAIQPAPAPRFSRTPADSPRVTPGHGAHTDEVLAAAGFATTEIAAFRASGVIG